MTDMDKWKEAAECYATATSVPCSSVSVPVAPEDSPCALCRHVSGDLAQLCAEDHTHSCSLAERFGGSYTYLCRLSLMFWASPVLFDGVVASALIAGPVLTLPKDEVAHEAARMSGGLAEGFLQELDQVKTLEIGRVKSLAELLRMCAAWVSGYSGDSMSKAHRFLDQQSRLSEYIHDLKRRFSGKQSQALLRYSLETEEQLQEAVRQGDHAAAQSAAHEILGAMHMAGFEEPKTLRFRIQEILALISRAAVKGGAETAGILESSAALADMLASLSSFEQMSELFLQAVGQYADKVVEAKELKHEEAIKKTLRFINESYWEKITLQQASAAAGFSPSYLSRIFKVEMRCSFSAYVNQVRISHAKKLLKHTSATLVEIAGMVGYDDQSYFSKVFKSVTGITPGSYRERSGTFPSQTFEIHDKQNV